MAQHISPSYLHATLTLNPGDRLHRAVALLFDTHIDDLTDARIAALEAWIEEWRWCNATGMRVDR